MKWTRWICCVLCAVMLLPMLAVPAAAEGSLVRSAKLIDAYALVGQAIPAPALAEESENAFRIVRYQWYRGEYKAGCEAEIGTAFEEDTYYLELTVRLRDAKATYITEQCYFSASTYQAVSCTVDPDAGAMHGVFSVKPLHTTSATITLPMLRAGNLMSEVLRETAITAEAASPSVVTLTVYENDALCAICGFDGKGDFVWTEGALTFQAGNHYKIIGLAAFDGWYITEASITNPAVCEQAILAENAEGAGFTAEYICCAFPFTDVAKTDWFYPGVEFCNRRGLMNGTSAARFSPASTCSRAMIVTVLYRLAGSPAVAYAPVFEDVPEKTWFTDAVIWAAQNGIVKGYGNGRFGSNDNITREQLAAIVQRYTDVTGKKTTEHADISTFPDADRVSRWAQDAMRWAVATGIVNGKRMNGALCLQPQGNATRAECATILMRYCTMIEGGTSNGRIA